MKKAKKKTLSCGLLVLIGSSFLAGAKADQIKTVAVSEIRYPSPAEERMLARPVDLEVEGTRLFVLDSQERKIKVYSLEGKWLYDIGRYGSGPGEFMHPVDMSIHRGEVAVLDSEAYQVKFFSADGSFAGSFQIGFRGYRLLRLNEETVVLSRLPRVKEKNASFLFYFDRKGKRLAEALKVSSTGNSGVDLVQFGHDLRLGGGKVAVVYKFGQEMAVFLDEKAHRVSSLKPAANHPSLSFRVNFPKQGSRDVQALAFTSAFFGEEIYLVCPGKMADGDLGPSGRVAVLSLKGEIHRFIDFPLAVFKLAVSGDRFFVLDEEAQLRVFALAGGQGAGVGEGRQ